MRHSSPTQVWPGRQLFWLTQAMGLMAGSALTNGKAADFGFLFIVFDPELLLPLPQFKRHLSSLIDAVKATPLQPGAGEIRIPSERAFAERGRRRRSGFSIDQRIYRRLQAL